jgi:cell division protein FtsI (penicillin-binding protein 3)
MTGPRLGRTAGTAAPVSVWVRRRICASGVLLAVALAALGYHSFGIQVNDGDHYREMARRQHLRTVELPAPRGAIYDAKGHELAVTANVDSVYANPREVRDRAATAAAVAEILGIDAQSVAARLASHRYFVWLKRHIRVDHARALRARNLPGIALAKEPRRYYPARDLAGPLLGFADIDGKGIEGVELAMNDLLRGRRTALPVVRDVRGRIVLETGQETPAGATIWLTVHRFIQYVSERALAEAVAHHRARAGTALVLDVRDGSVLALAAVPSYDPNDRKGRARARRHGARNRAITDAYEVGSIMKVFTIGAALDAGAVGPLTLIDVEQGRMRIGRKVIRDTHHDDILSVSDVLKRSSNVGAVKIARRLGAARLHAALPTFCFGNPTGIELPGERAGVVHPAERWGELGLAAASFGYGMTATPLQIAAALAAVGNGGILHEPRLIKQVVGSDGQVLYRHRKPSRRIMREQTAAALLPMLASVFDRGRFSGTAGSVTVDGFRAGGKTGTAHKIDPATRKYSEDMYLSSFIGLAPIEEPRIAVVVIIDEPRGEHHYGGLVAAPAFARIVSESLRYLGVPGAPADRTAQAIDPAANANPEQSELADTAVAAIDDDAGPDPERPVALGPGQVLVPNFVGMSLGRALDAARAAKLRVEIDGSGLVIEQFPRPGPMAQPGSCRLVLAGKSSGHDLR